jgi:hypothetical protein
VAERLSTISFGHRSTNATTPVRAFGSNIFSLKKEGSLPFCRRKVVPLIFFPTNGASWLSAVLPSAFTLFA